MGNVGKNLGIPTRNVGSGIPAYAMWAHLNEIQSNVRKTNSDAVDVLLRVRQNPQALITIYKATTSSDINSGDWVFLDRKHAERWMNSATGRKQKGIKLVQKTVHARELEWSKRNLEFLYK